MEDPRYCRVCKVAVTIPTPQPNSTDRIRRAFLAARARFASANSFDEQEDETSNMLHHLSRLVDARGGVERFASDPGGTRYAAGLVLRRHKDVHEVAVVARGGDVFSDTFTELLGTLVWTDEAIRADKRYARYDAGAVEGKPVIDTISAAFDYLIDLPVSVVSS